MPVQKPLTVAYFTMEIGLKAEIPTYAGGLGILAADLMLSAADLKIPAACVTIGWQHGYMHQSLKPDGSQIYSEFSWRLQDHLRLLTEKIKIKLKDAR